MSTYLVALGLLLLGGLIAGIVSFFILLHDVRQDRIAAEEHMQAMWEDVFGGEDEAAGD